jgi:ElaB/YqjD/DUF883 family membrane-anchored ribosome-binding protein
MTTMAADDVRTADGPTIGQRLDHAIDSTRDKFNQVASDTKERIVKGKETLAEYREKGRETVAELRKKNIDDIVTAAKEFAKEHPGTTLIGGIALGFLVGYMIKSSRD